MTLPMLIVDAPPVTPYQYGLASAATPAPTDDPHWRMGVQYEPIPTYAVAVYPGPCNTGRPSKPLPAGLGTVQGLPFGLYAGVDCKSVGFSEEYVLSRARAILDAGWQHGAEAALWNGGGVTGLAPVLNANGTPTVGTGLSLTAAVAALEKYLTDHYLGVGVIHATRDVAAVAQRQRQIVERVGKLQTVLGTQWVFGGGYDGTGPNNTAPTTGTTWLYATGALTIRRDAPTVPGQGIAGFLNRDTNQALVYAEQLAVLTVDGPIAAASVNLSL